MSGAVQHQSSPCAAAWSLSAVLGLHLLGWYGLCAIPVVYTPHLIVLHLGVSSELTKESEAPDGPALLQAARICCSPQFLGSVLTYQ